MGFMLARPQRLVKLKSDRNRAFYLPISGSDARFWYRNAMQSASREFLRAIRGERSQLAFARRLGFSGNPIANWEAGRRSPTAIEALRACERVGIDVPSSFARFVNIPLEHGPAGYRLGPWLDQLRGNTTAMQLASRSGYSRHQVRRWLSEEAVPKLPQFFRLVEAITGRLPDLVGELVPIELVPSLRDQHAQLQAARVLAHDQPWTEAILRLLETQDAHTLDYDAQQIAECLGISGELAERCLTQLVRAGIVQRDANRYHVISTLSVDTKALGQLKAHWSNVASERALAPQRGDVFCYNVLACSKPDAERIRSLLLATYREIRSIVANTPCDEVAAVVNLQLVGWGDHGNSEAPL
jgi:transcriptional regulator with XRE-family HTH domain